MKVRFLKVAQNELDDAIEYYELEQAGLGERLRGETVRSINRIAAFPNAFQSVSKRLRRCLASKFPYGIIYRYDADAETLLVVAFSHLHRKPNYWFSRE